MSDLVVDVETTIFQKGNPFARRNKLCYVGAHQQGGNFLVGDATILPDVRREIDASSRLVGFNIKFDLHWLRREGCTLDKEQRVWDCQLAHFLLSAQRERYPSLQGVCEHYGIKGKLDVVEAEFWSKGIDTPDVPRQIVLDYLSQDLRCTAEVQQRQLEDFKKEPRLYKLFTLQCADLLVLADMEFNGLLIDSQSMLKKAEEIHNQIQTIDSKLSQWGGECPINWDSVDHVSTVLYGGTIVVPYKEPVGVFKSGAKMGEPRYKWFEKTYVFPRLMEPLEGSELKKEGYWSTDDQTLRQVKDKTGITELLLRRAELTKQLDYYEGWPELNMEMDWPSNLMHPQLNQCVARTGRLSSSKPNEQNVPSDVKQFMVSRYENSKS